MSLSINRSNIHHECQSNRTGRRQSDRQYHWIDTLHNNKQTIDGIARITGCSVSSAKRVIIRSRTTSTPAPTRPSKYKTKFGIAGPIIKELIIDNPRIHDQQNQSKLTNHYLITLSTDKIMNTSIHNI